MQITEEYIYISENYAQLLDLSSVCLKDLDANEEVKIFEEKEVPLDSSPTNLI